MSNGVRFVAMVLFSAALVGVAESHPDESCATARRHELDFVIGNWLVRDSSGGVIGTATFARSYRGCVLIETWLGAGSSGESLGVIGYQPESRHWHRDFLGPGGGVIAVEGQMEGGSMVLTGKDYPADGPRMNRVAWTPAGNGTVEERWETSTDAGRSWQMKLHGVFHRISE